jgi:Mn2+/Fe2+ NRAMP family transporter
VPSALRSAGLGIGVATVMRVVLFLGALGVVSAGLPIDPAQPPASVFRHAAGLLGYRLFGAVMWAAAMTSVVGSAYTSVTFLRTLGAGLATRTRSLTLGFVALSTLVFLAVGRPVEVLVAVGALNGLILPVGLGTMLVAAVRERAATPHPLWLAGAGGVVALMMAGLGLYTVVTELPPLFR